MQNVVLIKVHILINTTRLHTATLHNKYCSKFRFGCIMAEEKPTNNINDIENSLEKHKNLPEILNQKSCLCKCCFITGIICTMLFILIFVGFPLTVMNSVDLQRSLIFMPDQGQREAFLNITKYVNGSRNFYITVNKAENITLGAWHFLPEALINNSIENINFNYSHSLSKPEYPVLLHFHGNGGSRWNNLPTFLILRQYFHVITFDYRSYGDSSKAELTEEGIVEDSIIFYKWLLSNTAPDNIIYVWGHSLGSALSTHTLVRLRSENIFPMGLILEAPFTTIREVIQTFYLSKVFKWLPWFNATMLNGFEENGFHFNTSENILKVDCPILILHAEDDILIPYVLGEKLAKIAQEKRDSVTQGKVIFHLFPKKFGYNHWQIPEAPEIPKYLKKFMNVCEEYINEKSKRNTTLNKH